MAPAVDAVTKEGFGATDRRDAWWLAPASVAAGLGILGLYLLWAAMQNAYFRFENYLSPVYSPEIHPAWWPLSPAFLILIPPLLFRTTCYYYRKAYYRAFFLDPAGCAVGELRRGKYTGETKFPFLLQNMHRYAFYLAFLWLFFLWYDVYEAFQFEHRFGIGLGSLVILASTGTLTLYTLSCHSWRHIVGGKLDCFSCTASSRARHGIWQRVTHWNEHHQLFAWISLFCVTAADVYVRLLAMGCIRDVRFL